MSLLPIYSFFVIASLSVSIYSLSMNMEGDARAMKRAHGYVWFAIISMVYLAANMAVAIMERLT